MIGESVTVQTGSGSGPKWTGPARECYLNINVGHGVWPKITISAQQLVTLPVLVLLTISSFLYLIVLFLYRCEVVVSGKLRGQRAKSMKFVDGLMIHSGDPCNDYVDTACRHVLLRQGVLGIKVRGLRALTRNSVLKL